MRSASGRECDTLRVAPQMPSTSAVLNRALRTHVVPVLRAAEFEVADARNAWLRRGKLIWVFNVRAVGRYFSDVTRWPPGSVGVQLGVFYGFMPRPGSVKRDARGRKFPKEYECQMRTDLECGLDQTRRTRRFPNPADRRRKDIWWIARDGSNADEAAQDIARALRKRG